MKKLLIAFSSAFLLLFGFQNGALAASNTYLVKSGDTLSKIAKTYKISVVQLKSWNHLTSDIIHPKQSLNISAVKSSTQTKKAQLNVVKEITVKATAYNVSCKKCSGITATGINLKKNPQQKVISVDPKVIKLGTKVYVEGYGYAIAADKGNAIKGNKIDVFISSHKEALKWGSKTVKVKILK
ncbi:3D domain-containing protein [Neobacillus sp. PS3-40]|uniref:3D domain-containing protein n=1 Tax=Neobacillus sp. PS3-40 TaxID=3070679 RepID=UPI0027E1696D|nr:3D domain-containing protein [Neobacillus sp. PS3-40]WML43784.1 3D domain-containing protein [Neobacillus sp. PS3-40]